MPNPNHLIRLTPRTRSGSWGVWSSRAGSGGAGRPRSWRAESALSRRTLSKIEHGDPSVGLGAAFEAARPVGVSLFHEDSSALRRKLPAAGTYWQPLPDALRGPGRPSMTTSEPREAFVWVWLPGAIEPVVACRLDRSERRADRLQLRPQLPGSRREHIAFRAGIAAEAGASPCLRASRWQAASPIPVAGRLGAAVGDEPAPGAQRAGMPTPPISAASPICSSPARTGPG